MTPYGRFLFQNGQYVGARPYVGDTFSDAIDAANKQAADAAAANNSPPGYLNPGVIPPPSPSPPLALVALAGLAAVVLYLQFSKNPFAFLGARR